MTVTPEQLADAMQTAWNEHCADTGCYPDDFRRVGNRIEADFRRGPFAALVASWLNLARAVGG